MNKLYKEYLENGVIDEDNAVDIIEAQKQEIERLNNIIENMEEELMTIYLDIMEYNEDYAKREIKELKGVDKE